jgi:WD40 repeat protein
MYVCVYVYVRMCLGHYSQLVGHRYGINHAAFSPSGRHVVTIGNAFDQTLQVWDWHDSQLLTTVKIPDTVTGLDFAADGTYFVTTAHRQLRYWAFDPSGQKVRARQPPPPLFFFPSLAM